MKVKTSLTIFFVVLSLAGSLVSFTRSDAAQRNTGPRAKTELVVSSRAEKACVSFAAIATPTSVSPFLTQWPSRNFTREANVLFNLLAASHSSFKQEFILFFSLSHRPAQGISDIS